MRASASGGGPRATRLTARQLTPDAHPGAVIGPSPRSRNRMVGIEQMGVLRLLLCVQPVRVAHIDDFRVVLSSLISDRCTLGEEDDLAGPGGLHALGISDREGTLHDDQGFIICNDPFVHFALVLVAIVTNAHVVAIRWVENVADEDFLVSILKELGVLAREMSDGHGPSPLLTGAGVRQFL